MSKLQRIVMPPECPYCARVAVLVTGADVYPHRPDLAAKRLWRCPNGPCDAYVGTHQGTDQPLGRLANLELRQAKIMAHACFDPIWRAKVERGAVSKKVGRKQAYNWLAQKMGLAFEDTHIGKFDVAQCRRVVELCRHHAERIAA